MPDVTSLLMRDHLRVERLFEQFDETGDTAVAVATCRELRRHTSLEEGLVYPVLHDEVSAELASHAVREHDEAGALIDRVEHAASAGSADLGPLMGELHQSIRRHVRQEERQVFPEMRDQLGDERLAQLGDAAARRKTEPEDDVIDLTKEEHVAPAPAAPAGPERR